MKPVAGEAHLFVDGASAMHAGEGIEPYPRQSDAALGIFDRRLGTDHRSMRQSLSQGLNNTPFSTSPVFLCTPPRHFSLLPTKTRHMPGAARNLPPTAISRHIPAADRCRNHEHPAAVRLGAHSSACTHPARIPVLAWSFAFLARSASYSRRSVPDHGTGRPSCCGAMGSTRRSTRRIEPVRNESDE
jgi:hypothetical protein